jgi:hypothetical protein
MKLLQFVRRISPISERLTIDVFQVRRLYSGRPFKHPQKEFLVAKPAIELIETRQGCEMCETTPRYNVMLHGVKVAQLYYNLRGYVGSLPTPGGCSLYVPESGISRFRREAARLNREFASANKAAVTK